MLQEHQNFDIKGFSKGANTDVSKEIVGQMTDGSYVDMKNGRPVSNEGNTGDAEKIKGEVVVYESNLPGTYECNASICINGHIVEFWCDTAGVEPSLCRVDGVIVLKSPLFDIVSTHPLQLDKNENCIGGEVFMTDYRVQPMILDIKDMIDSLISNPDKYFSGFDPALYAVNLAVPLDQPVFVALENVGGGGGLPVGSYEYQIRYSNKAGDRTNWSPSSPMIPVVRSLSSSSSQYPWSKTYGSAPDVSSKTSYGVKIRFRVTNLFGYDFIEIKRLAHNQGAGIGFVPQPMLIAKIDISDGEVSVRDFIDPVEANDEVAISDAEDTTTMAYIDAAKTIRYFDKRTVLMNVKLSPKESELTFEEVNGKKMFPVIDKLGKPGFNDPWNHAYRTQYMGGERYGFGVEVFDGVGGRGFVNKIPDFTNYQYPNRRHPIDPDSKKYSTGYAKATSTSNVVTDTFEVFDLADAEAKSDVASFKNIFKGDWNDGFKAKGTINEDVDPAESTAQIESHGAQVKSGLVTPGYNPYRPIADNDSDVSGHNYVVNPVVSVNSSKTGEKYRPAGFAPNYFSHGMALAGVDGFPAWAKSFSVVRTDSAKRVIAQGLGMYAMRPADFNAVGSSKLCTKWVNKLWFFSPDIENGVVSSSVLNDIIANPEGYKIQLVSPLGFFSEMYSFENTAVLGTERDSLIDMISYARVLRDNRDETENKIYPAEYEDMGINGGDGNNYIGYGKWRNTGQTPTVWSSPDGERLFNVSSVERISEGRGSYICIEVDENIYGTESTGGSDDSDFASPGLADWTEPFYIVNIVADGAIVRDKNIQKYKPTTHYQKLESLIGIGSGATDQSFELVDERWEDCIPSLTSTDYGHNIDRYVYIKKPTGVVEKWLNVTYKSPSAIALIKSHIAAYGVYNGDVKGLYTHTVSANKRFFEIVFNVESFYPQEEDQVLVKYDKTAPIKFWGGDTIIGESVFAPIDREGDGKEKGRKSNQFGMGVGWPYRYIKLNPRHYVVKRTIGSNKIQDESWAFLGFIRQMCMMFTVESRACVHTAYNSGYPLQYFPLMNYVMRPNSWEEDKSMEDQNIFADYVSNYGESEKDRWKWGGFRFTQLINPDYSNEPAKQYFSKPMVGFVEKTDFCTRVMWSLPRAVNVQNSPGLKTFPANNSYDLDDDQGGIKRAWEATGDRGENLYAITNNGIALLVTKKTILSDLDGGDVGYMAADTFIKHQLWLSKGIGMNDEMWRSAAEANIPLPSENGSQAYKEALFFANSNSVFRLMGDNVIDIGRSNYHTVLYNDALKNISSGYGTRIAAGYNNLHQEYWLSVKIADEKNYVFNQKNNEWTGTFDYRFDRYTSKGNKIYGHRGLKTYELGSGFIINDGNIVFEATQASALEAAWDKEFIRIRVNSNGKPTAIEFYDSWRGTKLCSISANQLKNYRGWEQFVGRKDVGVSPNRDRVQGRSLVYLIRHDLPEEFRLINAGLQYKKIK